MKRFLCELDADETIKEIEEFLKDNRIDRAKIKAADKTQFSFEGHELAAYIKKWYSVFRGKAPFFDPGFI